MPRDLGGLRVLLVGDYPPPLGGVSVHVRALRDAARKAGARTTVLDIGKGRNTAPGVVAATRPIPFAARLATLATSHDLIHLHTSGANPKSWLLVAGIGAMAKATGCASVVTFHSGHGPRYLVTPQRAFVARAALAPWNRVVCVSEEIERTLSRLGAAEGRRVVAPAFGREGVVPGELPPTARSFRATHRELIVAMLAPGRDYGAPELFSAFALLRARRPQAALVVYGAGTESEELRRMASTLGASPVLHLGQLERPQALAVMACADVFVRPTLVDGDAVSVREALALGVPVVATRVGARPQQARLCEPRDTEALSTAIEASLQEEATPAREGAPLDGIESVLELYGRLDPRQTAFAAPPPTRRHA